MAEFPKVEQQSTGHLLRDLKGVLNKAKEEVEANKAVLQHVNGIFKQNGFYEREIDGARGRIFMLLVAQIRNAEVACADEYVSRLESALADLTEKEKKEET